MKHAFLVTVYKDLEHLEEVVRYYDHDDAHFFIHLDAKAPPSRGELVRRLSFAERAYVLPDPINVHWGGFSHLEALLRLLGRAASAGPYGYFHALSGSDFPIRPFDGLNAFFEEHNRSQFIGCQPLASMSWTGGGFSRLQLYHLNDLLPVNERIWGRLERLSVRVQRALRVRRSLVLPERAYYAGGTWWSLDSAAVEYILDYCRAHQGFVESFRHTFCPEEFFFQTILMNSPLRKAVTGDDLRYIDWKTRNGSIPAVLDASDYPRVQSSGKMFARKLVPGISDSLLQLLKTAPATSTRTKPSAPGKYD